MTHVQKQSSVEFIILQRVVFCFHAAQRARLLLASNPLFAAVIERADQHFKKVLDLANYPEHGVKVIEKLGEALAVFDAVGSGLVHRDSTEGALLLNETLNRIEEELAALAPAPTPFPGLEEYLVVLRHMVKRIVLESSDFYETNLRLFSR